VGQKIAIVDAFDDPNAESDLAVYRSQFGLPPCTTANGCFRKVNQDGGAAPPPPNIGWGSEIDLDVDVVSAICPNCHILLVEADSSNVQHLAAAEDTAAALGADEISNSWISGEFASETSFDSSFNHPGIAITAGTGDNGYLHVPNFPSSSPSVTAVGGTTLTRSSGARGWSETAWSGAGSGCSKYEPKPAWQTDSGCPNRTVADVAAVADPATGVAMYDSFHYSGWLIFGGTSVSTPVIASVYALAGNAASLTGAQSTYAPTASLFDVTSGSNGRCGGSYLCTAGPGYDGPTGNGTPNGVGSF
jgi:subtilase family serine protease